MIPKPSKIDNLLDIIKVKAKSGKFILMPHAVERRYQRNIAISDIVLVLITGWHESKKDEYREEYSSWNYSIQGKTIDNRKLRIIVSFDDKNMLIVTVIHLDKR